MNFYLIICKDKFFIYSERREIVHIDGNPFFEYELSKIRDAVKRLIEKIVDENNLSDKNDLQFAVIENIDSVRNESVEDELGNLIVRKYPVGNILHEMILTLSQNPKLYINELGVNYDGDCYYLKKGELWRNEYSLLALSPDTSEIMKFVR